MTYLLPEEEMESKKNHAENMYFDAHGELDSKENRLIFCSGFEQGFEASELFMLVPCCMDFENCESACKVRADYWKGEAKK